MKQYYIDLRSCDELEHDRILKLVNTFAWDVYLIAGVPKVYSFMWDQKEPISMIPGIPGELVSASLPQNN